MSFDFKNDPIENFLKLYKEAQVKGVPEANAMALATVNEHNQPSVRIVFMKGVDERGFCFYTNYEGRKARDIEANNKVSANFFWPHLDQQVRIEGRVEKLTREESEIYFATRARTSQIGAWASNQSDKLDSYKSFLQKYEDYENKFKNNPVACPPNWGGYRILPHEIEFWFGKSGRLHERYVYQKSLSSWDKFLRSP
jgi:pyridoxamine 5'-phosphate oxidase